MEKILKKLIKIRTFLLIIGSIHSLSVFAINYEIIVDISEQRLFIVENNNIIESFPVSTSKYGEGEIENSFKTPLGMHEIKEKIGDGAKINTIFVSRINI